MIRMMIVEARSHLTPEVLPDLLEPGVGLLEDGLPAGVRLVPDPVQAEDDPLTLNGDVPGELHDALLLVMPAVQVDADLAEHHLHGIAAVHLRGLVPPPTAATSRLVPRFSSLVSMEIFSHDCLDRIFLCSARSSDVFSATKRLVIIAQSKSHVFPLFQSSFSAPTQYLSFISYSFHIYYHHNFHFTVQNKSYYYFKMKTENLSTKRNSSKQVKFICYSCYWSMTT